MRVLARCGRCRRERELELPALSAGGRGRYALVDLPLRYTGTVADPDGPGTFTCGARGATFTAMTRVRSQQLFGRLERKGVTCSLGKGMDTKRGLKHE